MDMKELRERVVTGLERLTQNSRLWEFSRAYHWSEPDAVTASAGDRVRR